MTTSTDNSNGQAPLAALSARVMRRGLRTASDAVHWVQRAAQRQARSSPATIGQSVDAFADGIAQRFPDVAARFVGAGDDAEGYAAIDMPFASAQGLVEAEAMDEEAAPAYERAAEFLAQVRNMPRPTQQPASRPAPPAVQRTTDIDAPNRFDQLRQRTAIALKPAAQTTSTLSSTSTKPVQRKPEDAAGTTQSKPARVISAVEEIVAKKLPAAASLRAMPPASMQTPAPPETAQPPALEAALDEAAKAPSAAQVDAPATQPMGDAMPPKDAASSREMIVPKVDIAAPALPIRRRANLQSVAPQHDGPDEAVLFGDAASARATSLPGPAQRQTAPQATVVSPSSQRAIDSSHEATPSVQASTPHGETHDTARVQRDAITPAQPIASSATTVSTRTQRHVESPALPASQPASQTPSLPLLRKAIVPQLGHAGQRAQRAWQRIARKSWLPMQMDELDKMDETIGDAWPAVPDVAAGMPPLANAALPSPSFTAPALDLPTAAFDMSDAPMRAALPKTPAMPRIDMPLAQARDAVHGTGAAAQMQAAQVFNDVRGATTLPAMPALSLPAALPQLPSQGMLAGGANALSHSLQDGMQSAASAAQGAFKTAGSAMSAITAAPKTDLDQLARQLLPHLKRMLALERERMRPF
jgi:hypothetical protein